MAEWAEEHDNIADLINRVGAWGGAHGDDAKNNQFNKALDTVVSHFDASVDHHNQYDYKNAHASLQLAAHNLGVAARLGSYHDENYGYSMPPHILADQQVRSYKHAFFS